MAKNQVEQASVTFQTDKTDVDRLETLAFALKITRKSYGEEVGNVSNIIRLLVEFMFDNVDLFQKWIAARIEKAANGE